MAVFLKKLAFFCKSLFYQGNFNTENMQGTGFAWLVHPELKKRNISLTQEEESKLNGYFNTNPSFITLAVGIFLKEIKNHQNTFAIKNIHGSAFAALGDSFFWHGLRPFLFLLALVLCLYISPWGVLIYPLVYTLFHLFFLILGFSVGEHMGSATITLFNRVRFNAWADITDKASIFLMGVLAAQLCKATPAAGSSGVLLILAAVALFAIGFILYKHMRPAMFTWILAVLVISILFCGGLGL